MSWVLGPHKPPGCPHSTLSARTSHRARYVLNAENRSRAHNSYRSPVSKHRLTSAWASVPAAVPHSPKSLLGHNLSDPALHQPVGPRVPPTGKPHASSLASRRTDIVTVWCARSPHTRAHSRHSSTSRLNSGHDSSEDILPSLPESEAGLRDGTRRKTPEGHVILHSREPCPPCGPAPPPLQCWPDVHAALPWGISLVPTCVHYFHNTAPRTGHSAPRDPRPPPPSTRKSGIREPTEDWVADGDPH